MENDGSTALNHLQYSNGWKLWVIHNFCTKLCIYTINSADSNYYKTFCKFFAHQMCSFWEKLAHKKIKPSSPNSISSYFDPRLTWPPPNSTLILWSSNTLSFSIWIFQLFRHSYSDINSQSLDNFCDSRYQYSCWKLGSDKNTKMMIRSDSNYEKSMSAQS